MFSFSPPVNLTGLLGQPFGSQVPYQTTLGAEEQQRYNGTMRRVKLKCFPITFMDQYSNKSFEQLRYEDYSIGRKSGVPKQQDLAVVMTSFIPQTYTTVCDAKMTDTRKLSSSLIPFGNLNNCFGSTGPSGHQINHNHNAFASSSNLFGSSFSPGTGNLFGSTSNIPPTFNFQTTFGNSQSVQNSTQPIFSFNNSSTPLPSILPPQSTPFSFSQNPTQNASNTFPTTQLTKPVPQGCTQIHVPTYFGQNIYPIFNGPSLVGYTMNDITFNPSKKTQNEIIKLPSNEHVGVAWKEFYEFCQTHKLKLLPTSKADEFILDTDPSRKSQWTFEAYDKLWNHPHPLKHSGSHQHHQSKNSEGKIHSNKYWETLNLKQLATPYTDASLAQKCRRSLLHTDKIFPSHARQNELTSNSKVQQTTKFSCEPQLTRKSPRKANRLAQFQSEFNCLDKKLQATRRPFPTSFNSFIVDKMSAGEAHGQSPKIKDKDSEDNLTSMFTVVGSDTENVKIIDRSRRPRSKSLSVRPRGKSCGVHLTRDRYYCIPSIQVMDTMVDEYGRCIVENFEVGHMDYGHMVFENSIDVAGINLDEIVVFNLKEMFLYPATDQDCDLPLSLQKLNQPALVTLVQVWPQRHGTNEFIRDLDIINSINYEFLLQKTCERMGVQFVSYDPVKGHWKFRIQDNVVHIEE